jgi:hypothetical protein
VHGQVRTYSAGRPYKRHIGYIQVHTGRGQFVGQFWEVSGQLGQISGGFRQQSFCCKFVFSLWTVFPSQGALVSLDIILMKS